MRYRLGSSKYSVGSIILMIGDIHTYKTVLKPSEGILYKEKKSKFYGYAFPLQCEDDVRPLLKEIRIRHLTAGHVCYAWKIGLETIRYRVNDDGEPNNSAGMPIYGQIQSFEVTNILIAVARIYGGTKLGVGGLISAYREAAKMSLTSTTIVNKAITWTFVLIFAYSEIDIVMKILKKGNYPIISQQLEINCKMVVEVNKNKVEHFEKRFSAYHQISISKIKQS